jgi:hypothetical protein
VRLALVCSLSISLQRRRPGSGKALLVVDFVRRTPLCLPTARAAGSPSRAIHDEAVEANLKAALMNAEALSQSPASWRGPPLQIGQAEFMSSSRRCKFGGRPALALSEPD